MMVTRTLKKRRSIDIEDEGRRLKKHKTKLFFSGGVAPGGGTKLRIEIWLQ